jgi:8-oxo-dGTP pyrophosphatase MutT (NUDIX family)
MQLPGRLRASSVVVHAGRLLCVRLRDPSSRVARLFVPGGAIEPGESPAQAAVRETFEETGYRIALRPDRVRVLSYPYEWDGCLRQITTHFFAACLLDPAGAPAIVRDAPYHEGVEFVPLADLKTALGFHPEMLQAIESLL